MTDLLKAAIRELVPGLSDDIIYKLIDATRTELALTLYNYYEKNRINTQEDDESQLSWARKATLDLDYCRSVKDEMMEREIAICKSCEKRFSKMGDTVRADKFTKIISGAITSSAGNQEHLGYATNELNAVIAQEEDLKKQGAETTRKMEEDLSL